MDTEILPPSWKMRARPVTDEDRAARDKFKRDVARRLVAAREALGLSRNAWIRRYHIIPSRFAQWEAGTNLPDVMLLARICDDHGLSLDYLLRGKVRVPAVLQRTTVSVE